MNKTLLLLSFCLLNMVFQAQSQIDSRIQEVYAGKTEEMVASNPTLLTFLNDLLSNRIKIQQVAAEDDNSKFTKLSQLDLLNKYNPSLQRDAVFNPQTFNPLKYNMEFTSNSVKKVYLVDNTNYIIVIEPQTINH